MARTILLLGCLFLLTTLVLGEKAISNKKGDACCGGEAYFQNLESCCDGKVIKGIFSACCDGKGFNPEDGEICCRGDEVSNNYKNEKDRKPKFEVLINEKTLKGPNSLLMPLECCGKGVIDTRIQVCCDGKAFDTREKEGDMCCGGKLVDSKNGVCCSGEFTKYKNKQERDTLQCCGDNGNAFNPEDEMCCGDKTFKIPRGQLVNETRCCGDFGIYHTATHTCCVEDHPQDGLLFNTLLGFGECCANRLYNPASSTCCRNEAGRAEVVSGANAQCCGISLFNPANSICCDESILSQNLGDSCCGNTPYNSATETCCESEDNSGNVNHRVLNGLGTCCGNRLITEETSSNVTCCDGEILQGTGECCGNKLISNSNTHACCGKTVVDLIDDGRTECCGETLFNPNFEVCCSDEINNVEKGDACCGANGYYQDHQSCCNGKVVYGTEAEGLRCCGQKGYFPESSTCCLDEKDTIILGKVLAICCDGKELGEEEVCCRD